MLLSHFSSSARENPQHLTVYLRQFVLRNTTDHKKEAYRILSCLRHPSQRALKSPSLLGAPKGLQPLGSYPPTRAKQKSDLRPRIRERYSHNKSEKTTFAKLMYFARKKSSKHSVFPGECGVTKSFQNRFRLIILRIYVVMSSCHGSRLCRPWYSHGTVGWGAHVGCVWSLLMRC